ncbi:ROK family transcriptional regulator [Clostridium paraputrificum]|uniref:ROK family transcriptional regulator n=1 Tax=Clostridium TaxID=1485 RepID=UPI003D340518
MSNIAGNQKEIKKVNRSLIMESIKKKGSTTRQKIVEDTGVSQTTVRSIISELLKEGEIIINGQGDSTGGRRAEIYSINKNRKLALVIYFSREGLTYNVLNFIGDKITSGVVYRQRQVTIGILKEVMDRVLENYDNISGIVISVPGVVSKEGYYSGYELNDWVEYPIRKYIRENYNIPVIIENDLNVISLGYAIDKNIEDVVYICLTSLGAGAGIIVDNKIIDGSTNFAGEIGALPYKDGIINNLLSKEFSKKECIDITSYLIATVNCILNPQAIVVGGEIFKMDCKKAIVDRLEEISTNKTLCEIEFNKDEENYAVIGATKLALKLIDEKVLIVKA